MKKSPVPTLRMHCLRLAGREHGLATSEVTGYSATQVRQAVWHLKNDGLIFSAKLSHQVVRYFSDEARAKAYQAKHGKPGAATQAAGRKLSLPPKASQRAWWPKDAEPVITEKTKITVAPPPPEWSTRSNTHSRWGG